MDHYERRFEEGYDLYDPTYMAWLEVNHPEAVPADRYMLTPTPRVAKVPSTESTPNSSSSSSLSPSTSTQVSGASIQKSTPSLNTSSSSSSPSPLTKFLKPLPPSLSTPRSSKVGKTGARVLTSSECLGWETKHSTVVVFCKPD